MSNNKRAIQLAIRTQEKREEAIWTAGQQAWQSMAGLSAMARLYTLGFAIIMSQDRLDPVTNEPAPLHPSAKQAFLALSGMPEEVYNSSSTHSSRVSSAIKLVRMFPAPDSILPDTEQDRETYIRALVGEGDLSFPASTTAWEALVRGKSSTTKRIASSDVMATVTTKTIVSVQGAGEALHPDPSIAGRQQVAPAITQQNRNGHAARAANTVNARMGVTPSPADLQAILDNARRDAQAWLYAHPAQDLREAYETIVQATKDLLKQVQAFMVTVKPEPIKTEPVAEVQESVSAPVTKETPIEPVQAQKAPAKGRRASKPNIRQAEACVIDAPIDPNVDADGFIDWLEKADRITEADCRRVKVLVTRGIAGASQYADLRKKVMA